MQNRGNAAIHWFVRTVMEIASLSARNDNNCGRLPGRRQVLPVL
jgi:hypothetical protein